ncbi:PepSY domain-containing protein [Paludibacterium paludis]|uniref:PepSY domain-containing protein n=1 Tax=Paludibacterium paludis TaxID=1225769 RepID=A0A918NZV2_9NEIS|nr:PepSY domain-containing protein [Paludibacterium paludis]GGY08014.1 hypothetical protein GCM10011289_08260 [Paludibacterium paludis]
MKRMLAMTLFVSMAAISASTFASEHCRDVASAPEASRLSEAAARKELTRQGYTVDELFTCRHGYSFTGRDKNGNKVQARLDPATGKVLSRHRDHHGHHDRHDHRD